MLPKISDKPPPVVPVPAVAVPLAATLDEPLLPPPIYLLKKINKTKFDPSQQVATRLFGDDDEKTFT